jgi:hypothetical protein
LVTNNYQITTAAVTGTAPVFTITFDHGAGTGTGAGNEVKEAFYYADNTCALHGDAVASGLTSPGSVTLGTVTQGVAQSSVVVTADPGAGPFVTEDVDVDFCVVVTSGDGTNVFGFYEIGFTVTFSFNGAWTGVTFATQAYDPITGQGGTQDITMTPTNCAGPEYYPGEVICIKVCPDQAGYEIISIETLTVDGTAASSYGEYTTEDSATANCWAAKFLIPMSYFPTLAAAPTDVAVQGTAKYQSTRRVLVSGRHLQESGNANMDAQVTLDLQPVQESSANGVILGAASAVAMGAALLI